MLPALVAGQNCLFEVLTICEFFHFLLHNLLFFPFVMEKYDEILKKVISTREGHVKHSLADQNTQHKWDQFVEKFVNGTNSLKG